MADNITLSANIGTGADLATEDISSVHYQKIKLTASGTSTTADLTHAEDTAHTTGDHGLMALGVRRDADTSLVGTDGDYAPFIVDANGYLKVEIFDGGGSHTVDNAGTFVIQEDGAALTALQVIDNYVYVDDADWTATTSSHALVGGIYQSSPGSITDGDTGPFRVDVNGAIHINDGGNSITIDGTVTANLSATDNAVLDQIEVNTSYGDNTGAGTEANSLRVTIANDSTGLLSIDDNGGSITVDNGGTFAVQATLAAETTKVIGTVNVAAAQTIAVTNAGTFATQATLQANSGVDIGDVDVLTCGTVTPGTGATSLGKAQDTAVGSTDTGVAMLVQRDDEQAAVTPADGDYVVPRCDKFGNLKTTQLPDATSVVKYAIIDAASSGDNTLQAAAGAGIKIRVLSLMMMSAGTVTARFESGAGGTALSGQMNLVVNTGFTLPFNPAGWFETADNALLNLELSGAISVDGMLTYVEV